MDRFLPGSDKYRREPEKRHTPADDMVDRANQFSIFVILEDFFGITQPREGGSYKARCPFAFEHPDGGLDKGWRTYPASNSSYCFVQHGVMGPVRLVQLKRDVRPMVAAKVILEKYHLLRPRHYAERFADLRTASESHRHNLGQAAYAVEALQMALSQMPEYSTRQFDADVTDCLDEELEKLDEVMSDPASTVEAVRRWYRAAKARLLAQVALR